MLQVRELIFATAAAHHDVGKLSETLKWGEPAYLTDEACSGGAISSAASRTRARRHPVQLPDDGGDRLRGRFTVQFEYGRARALLLPLSGALPKLGLTVCLSLALTYHLDQRVRKAGWKLRASTL